MNDESLGIEHMNKPAWSTRYGAIRAAVWRNVLVNGNSGRLMYNVTFSRSYKDGEDNWKDSLSFGYDDLLIVAKAANDCHTWIAQQFARDAQEAKTEAATHDEQPTKAVPPTAVNRGK